MSDTHIIMGCEMAEGYAAAEMAGPETDSTQQVVHGAGVADMPEIVHEMLELLRTEIMQIEDSLGEILRLAGAADLESAERREAIEHFADHIGRF
ncbi:MAG: hypothetical protein KAI82_17755, partial [Tritonibacter mobilis]|nr:hypothetical protein [Tritonibacter mobilis]